MDPVEEAWRAHAHPATVVVLRPVPVVVVVGPVVVVVVEHRLIVVLENPDPGLDVDHRDRGLGVGIDIAGFAVVARVVVVDGVGTAGAGHETKPKSRNGGQHGEAEEFGHDGP
jgi:hypothetical protein